jgi:hypothetical protein
MSGRPGVLAQLNMMQSWLYSSSSSPAHQHTHLLSRLMQPPSGVIPGEWGFHRRPPPPFITDDPLLLHSSPSPTAALAPPLSLRLKGEWHTKW